MRILAPLALIAVTSVACGGGGLFRQYEYEEDIYLSLDGSATVYVNSSIPALDALRGVSLNPSPNARIDRADVRAIYETPVSHVTRVSTSRRNNRRFVHLRLEVPDIRRLGEAAPFAWSTYDFHADGNLFVYRQRVGASAVRPAGGADRAGDELVAFRLHLPSKIAYHNTLPGNLKRGNILVWEQPLSERLRGTPLAIEARMETQSILYRTLWLFGVTMLVVALCFAVVLWLIVRRGGRRSAEMRT